MQINKSGDTTFIAVFFRQERLDIKDMYSFEMLEYNYLPFDSFYFINLKLNFDRFSGINNTQKPKPNKHSIFSELDSQRRIRVI